ncbi:hypothetical protein BRADI_4g18875v3 [Brachypodium distachyon]|uniref:Uncharacterized protein n=1 Tax=Brachypodium distachyon TaxID=15368 RepID=A0A2K2CNL3_BRADI|nr:hypothetical protein BRADI_4g18875v3 [Brachypodium distachyon]
MSVRSSELLFLLGVCLFACVLGWDALTIVVDEIMPWGVVWRPFFLLFLGVQLFRNGAVRVALLGELALVFFQVYDIIL